MTQTLNTSAHLPETVCDTTSIRYFTICGRFDLLPKVFGGKVFVPRQVFDPTEDAGGVWGLQSEIVKTEAHFSRNLTTPENMTYWSRFHALHPRKDIVVLDMNEDELALYAEFTSDPFRRQANLVRGLGPGESAVMAIAEKRDWNAAIDDGVAREVFSRRAPALTVFSTRDLVRACAWHDLISTDDAINLYKCMKDLNYRGPDSLY